MASELAAGIARIAELAAAMRARAGARRARRAARPRTARSRRSMSSRPPPGPRRAARRAVLGPRRLRDLRARPSRRCSARRAAEQPASRGRRSRASRWAWPETAGGADGRGRGAVEPGPAGATLERLRHADFSELDAEDLDRASGIDGGARAPRPACARSRRCLRPAPPRGHAHRRCARARSATRCATAASRCGGAGASRACARAGLSSCATRRGSMRPYAEGLLLYVQALVAARRGVEAFVFGTRLTRVTAELARARPRARARAAGRGASRTGPAARGSASRCARSTASTAGASAAAPP